MVKLACFSIFSSYYIQIYIDVITVQVDKQKGKLKLCQACPAVQVLSKIVCQPLQVPHTLCLFINLSEMSIQKMTSWNYFELQKNLDVNLHKKIEPVFVKHYAPNICLPLNLTKVKR